MENRDDGVNQLFWNMTQEIFNYMVMRAQRIQKKLQEQDSEDEGKNDVD